MQARCKKTRTFKSYRAFLAVLLTVAVLVSACFEQAMPVTGQAGAEATFIATELLGRPTNSSVTINVIAQQELEVYFEFGTQSGVYTNQTSIATFPAEVPIEAVIGGLQNNARYYYRMVYRQKGTTAWITRDEHSFQTQRLPGNTFTFTIISDSHVGFLGTANLYQQALQNVRGDNPDFHLDLGDTFSMDNVNTAAQANNVYLTHRSYFGSISDSTPIFLVIGNHENEEGWNSDDPVNLPLLSVNARKQYYLNPIPDGFYTGNTDSSQTAVSGDHLREDYYAWQWGDALFVCIDPFWYTPTKTYTGSEGGEKDDETVIGDRWSWTLGAQQYQWFKQTLEGSNAKYKFIFAHHMTGGTEGYVRGGAKPAPYFEWGGKNADETWGFDDQRSGWVTPIHQLMVENNVTAFFHGHDHFFAKEERDGIVYQGCPMPADTSYGTGFYNSKKSSYPDAVVYSNSGHLRVTVSPEQVTVDYVRAYLTGGNNGQVAYTYTMPIDTTPTPTPPPTPTPTTQPTYNTQTTTTPTPKPTAKPQQTPTASPNPTTQPSSSPSTPPTNPLNTTGQLAMANEALYALIIVVVIIAAGATAVLIRKRSKNSMK